jgi:hypothetical protein
MLRSLSCYSCLRFGTLTRCSAYVAQILATLASQYLPLDSCMLPALVLRKRNESLVCGSSVFPGTQYAATVLYRSTRLVHQRSQRVYALDYIIKW